MVGIVGKLDGSLNIKEFHQLTTIRASSIQPSEKKTHHLYGCWCACGDHERSDESQPMFNCSIANVDCDCSKNLSLLSTFCICSESPITQGYNLREHIIGGCSHIFFLNVYHF